MLVYYSYTIPIASISTYSGFQTCRPGTYMQVATLVVSSPTSPGLQICQGWLLRSSTVASADSLGLIYPTEQYNDVMSHR